MNTGVTDNGGGNPTHVLMLGGESFTIFHKNRRLYGFCNWKESRDRLIKLMLEKIKLTTGHLTAFINFRSVNPMRKTRLGNFFLEIDADILVNGVSLGTPKELGMDKLFTDSYVPVDEAEIRYRAEIEFKHSSSQYDQELEIRTNSIKSTHPHMQFSEIYEMASSLMKKDGWDRSLDNRVHSRLKRLNS